jgi:hypothetical protein
MDLLNPRPPRNVPETRVANFAKKDFMVIRNGPPKRGRAPDSLSEEEKSALMANVGLSQWTTFDKVPDVGSAVFDFYPPAATRGRRPIRRDDFEDRISVLVIATSVGGHFRLGEREDCFFFKVRNGRLEDPGFPIYDFTHVPPSKLRIIQIAISGLALRYGLHNIPWAQLVSFIKRQVLDIEPDFMFDLCVVQAGTNDAAYGLRPSTLASRPLGQITTEDLFQEQIESDASSLGLAFSKTVALLGAGSSSIKSPLPSRFVADLAIGRDLDSTEVHHIVHRMHLRSLVASFEELYQIGSREIIGVIHSPLSFYPGQIMQRGDLDKLGHVQARFYGDVAVDFSNCIQYALAKRFPDYSPTYALCPGLPAMFQANLQDITTAITPDEDHCHFGDTALCPGTFAVRSRAEGGTLGICWSDLPDFTRSLYGETVTTAMYLN